MKKPSVTELLDLLAKPALLGWANKLGLQGIDIREKRKASLAKGTSIHAQIEAFCKGNESAFEREMDREQFLRMMDGRRVCSVEKEIETEWFVGRYDAKFDCENGPCIVDYKRGFKGKVYLENKLQLVAYTMADPGDMAIVGVPGFVFVPVEIMDRRPYEQILIKLSELFYLKKECSDV